MAMTPEYVIVLTTLPADAENDAFGRTLVEERLAACVNLLPPMESVYRWEGSGRARHRAPGGHQDRPRPGRGALGPDPGAAPLRNARVRGADHLGWQ